MSNVILPFPALRNYLNIVLLGAVLGIVSCTRHSAVTVKQPAGQVSVSSSFLMPKDSANAAYSSLNYPKAVYQYYAAHSYNMVWLGQTWNSSPDSLKHFIRSSRLYGLLPQDYHSKELKEHEADPDFFYRQEALLTDAFLTLASDLKFGRIVSNVDPNKDTLVLAVLDEALKKNRVKGFLKAQEPTHRGYHDLKKALFEILSAPDSTTDGLLFAGITIDSIDLHQKVQRIEINMDRWRAELPDLKQRYVWINIPTFELQVFENEQVVLASRIIVGKRENPTPVLSSLIECITLFPFWYVPRKIAMGEYLPEIQRDTSFLTKNNFDVLDRKGNILNPDSIDWQSYSSTRFPVSLRQREGPENSLGVIKFVFDNPFAIFLHDTNAKNLFRKNTRAFSHGCIRMEKAVELAKYLAPHPEAIERQLRLQERHTISLDNPIPIYTRYLTCDYRNGQLRFYDDIYGLDEAMIVVLYNQSHCYATD